MALTITEPIKTVEGLLTKALAADSQLLYTAQREDYLWNRILEDNNNLGFMRVLLIDELGDITADFSAGDIIFVNDEDGNYTGLHIVRDADFDGTRMNIRTNTVFTVDSLFPANAYLNNLTTKQNYRIAVDIFDADDNSLIFDKTFFYVPNQAGLLTFDVGNMLITYMKIIDVFSKEYFLELTEEWEGSSESATTLTTLQAILAFKQLLKQGGANMFEFLLRDDTIGTSGVPGRFLTEFKTPMMWRGWNRTVGFLIDQELGARSTNEDMILNAIDVDINKGLIGSGINVISPFGVPTVIIGQVVFQNGVNAAFVKMVIVKDNSSELFSEELFYLVEDECPEPIMLDWINSKGGVEQHLFSINQTITNDSGIGVLTERPIISDIETLTRTKRRFPGDNIQRMILTAEALKRNEIIALHEMKHEESLRVYLSKDGVNFVDAVVTNIFATTYTTETELSDFSIEIEFPDGFSFEDGKLY